MQRFYIPKKLAKIEIFENEKFHQVTRVLRMRIGEEIKIFNHLGEEFFYKMISANKKFAEFEQLSMDNSPNPESDTEITLFQALPNKLEKIEWILEKNIEIGVRKFVFFRSERSQKLFLSDPKKERLLNIAREALEQCGWRIFPEIIFSDENVDKIFAKIPEKNIVLHTGWEITNFKDFDNCSEIGIWVGPEWWWSDVEIQKMNSYQFITARFWNRILRTETAGMVMSFGFLYK